MGLVNVKDLKIYFSGRPRMFGRNKSKVDVVHAVDGVTVEIEEGEIISLVGESGCGKTTTGMGILRLVDVHDGSIEFRGDDVLAMNSRDLRNFRGKAQMIFQATVSSLDPRMTVREIVSEPLRIHNREKDEDAIDEILVETLGFMGLKSGDLDKFPHEFSGGQARRIGVARALVMRPEFIVADEPTSGLDVSVAAGILNLMRDLRDKFNLTYLWISHNLHAVSFISDRIAVMYLGRIVEIAKTSQLIKELYHPYTKALFSAVPTVEAHDRVERIVLEGEIPSALNPPSGCRFHTRCNRRMAICSEKEPELIEKDSNHFVRCHLYQ